LLYSEEKAKGVNHVVQLGLEALKPGWFRINLNYFFDFQTTEFICNAIEFIAKKGWKLAPDYIINKTTGLWSHKNKLKHFSVRHITGN